MHGLYEFVSGPMVWLSFILFFGGSIFKLIAMGMLAKQKDPIVFEYMSPGFALRSILHWIIPFGSVNMRKHPYMTLVTFVFHLSLLLLPLFVLGHIMLWEESWGISWWYLPEGLADVLTLMVLGSCIFFLVRRLVLPEVKYLTTASDFILLAIVAAPFLTGFMAYHQLGDSQFMTILHIFSGEVMLGAIPFTRLSHMLLFPFTRGYMGSEFGAVKNARDW